MSNQTLDSLIQSAYPEIPAQVRADICLFQSLLAEENKNQNLTRLVEGKDFIEGHLADAYELLRSDLVEFPAIDLGSGGGVPGLLAAILGSGPWVLVESEKKKAEFLSRAVERLGLQREVGVFPGRIEDFMKTGGNFGSIVARAVGTVGKIYGWVSNCSTWNNLVLMKSRSWNDEWAEFTKTKAGKRLNIEDSHEYTTGEDKKHRIILSIARRVTPLQ